MRFRLAQFRDDIRVQQVHTSVERRRLAPSQSAALWNLHLELRLIGEQPLLEAGSGSVLYSPPERDGHEHSFLFATPGHYLRPLAQRRVEQLAEASLGVLHLPIPHPATSSCLVISLVR